MKLNKIIAVVAVSVAFAVTCLAATSCNTTKNKPVVVEGIENEDVEH